MSQEEADFLLNDVKETLASNASRKKDIIASLKNSGEIAAILIDCDRKSALKAADIFKRALDDYCLGRATYPDDAGSVNELLELVRRR